MKRYILIGFLMCIGLHSYAQKVTNVRSTQSGDKIVVLYDLSGKADVSMTMKAGTEKQSISRLSGDIGKGINKGQDRKIIWDVMSEYPDGFEADSVVFTVKAYPQWRTFVLAEGAVSPSPLQYSGGIMIGRAARWGYYLKFRSSFMFAPSNDGYFSSSYVHIGSSMMPVNYSDISKLITGKTKNTEIIGNVGAMCNFSMNTDYPMYVYLGLGYGLRRQMWEFNGGKWLQYEQTAYEGASVDFGLMFALKGFLLDIGVNTINFQYAEVQFGIGWLFNK